MGLKKRSRKGEEPIPAKVREDLKSSFVRFPAELEELEAANMLEAEMWLLGKSLTVERIVDEAFLQRLHREMFGQVWKRAGRYRENERAAGVKAVWIPVEMKKLVGDTRLQIKAGAHPPLEIAIRFKRRLSAIQCFRSGNGRHARLASNLLGKALTGARPFTWGRHTDLPPGELQKTYLEALRKADAGDVGPLLGFSLS